MHNPSCVSVPARLGIELQSTWPAVVRREKGVEWLGLSGWGSVVRREKGVEWLGLGREKGEGG